MNAVVLAYHGIGCAGIKALLRNGFNIAAVFTHADDANETIWFDSVAVLAASYNIPTFAPENINHPLWVKKIRELKPDILFSFYYRRLVTKDILDIPPEGCLNLHGSLLPKYRGRSPVNWVLVHGETVTGVTLHYMTPRADDGDIVAQTAIPISEDDTAKTLSEKSVAAATELLDDVLPRLKQGTAPRIPQNHSQASYFGGRTPADGEIDWTHTAKQIRNLVRAVTRPYPGAFSHLGGRKCFFWQVTENAEFGDDRKPGAVLSTDPLVIACGQGAVRVDFGQLEGGIYTNGSRLAQELGLAEGMNFGPHPCRIVDAAFKRSVLILGVNGFIGNALSERLLESGRYQVHGMDLHECYVRHLLDRPDFHFHEGDIAIHREWIEYHVKKCDIVIPLVAIATPIEYVRNPLKVFELDFEENLRVIRYCVRYKKRVVFPSTSEVYGMCEDEVFDEYSSRLVTGPIHKQRWIYACSKQLLDRVIWAYGQTEGLPFTLFRPFNWIGPKLDSLLSARIGSSRAITQLILNLTEGTPIQLVDGGAQQRCFTDVADGIDCLFRILENKNGVCDGKIFNIGNPENQVSIRELADILVKAFERHPMRNQFPPFAGIVEVDSRTFYGKGYQDVHFRRPSIRAAQRLLGWQPQVPLHESVERTLDFFLKEAVKPRELAGENSLSTPSQASAYDCRTPS
jgi:UDP-4-amino-4-deoxy-L-arabinose formyltransferase / UDP-glucuronic acid dehydrogenase (UDP-4-keto-hexauronic acid decarboxylating)